MLIKQTIIEVKLMALIWPGETVFMPLPEQSYETKPNFQIQGSVALIPWVEYNLRQEKCFKILKAQPDASSRIPRIWDIVEWLGREHCSFDPQYDVTIWHDKSLNTNFD